MIGRIKPELPGLSDDLYVEIADRLMEHGFYEEDIIGITNLNRPESFPFTLKCDEVIFACVKPTTECAEDEKEDIDITVCFLAFRNHHLIDNKIFGFNPFCYYLRGDEDMAYVRLRTSLIHTLGIQKSKLLLVMKLIGDLAIELVGLQEIHNFRLCQVVPKK
ncbi:hypothetical protein ACFL24_00560 [Patescibacteria group bacterium]